jgi:predicted RNase H-like nuclease (RuvC/YqgF family)
MANELENTTNVETTAETSESERRVKALEAEIAKLKQSVTNASADASKYKKEKQEIENQLKSKMTEEERARAEQEAATAAMQQELEMLRNERNVANHKAQLVSIGFEENLAQETAEAINAGETAKLFDGIRKFIATHDKELQAKSLMNNPVLSGGEAKKTMSREEFNKMGYTERVKLFNEDPELYKEMTKTT